MAARHHNNHDGSANDDFAAGCGTADCWASRPSDGFSHLHRLTASSARELHCGTGRNRADIYERNRRILLIPLSGAEGNRTPDPLLAKRLRTVHRCSWPSRFPVISGVVFRSCP